MATILVADDEEAILGFFQSMLDREGFGVVTARNGREALELCAKDDGDLVLAILDVQMPVMTGPEAVGHLRRMCPDLPIVLMSGYDAARVAVVTHGTPVGFISKPFTVQTLKETVRKALTSRGYAA